MPYFNTKAFSAPGASPNAPAFGNILTSTGQRQLRFAMKVNY
jgi:hypothetical protein